LKEYRARLRKETYELLKAEAERRRIPISQLVDTAVFWFLHGHRPVESSYPISDLNKVLSEMEKLKQEVEKIKRFLLKRFGMEVYGLT